MSEIAVVRRADDAELSHLVALRYRWRTEESGESRGGLDGFEQQFREWYLTHRESHIGYLLSVSGEPVGCGWLFIIDRIPGPELFLRRAGMIQSVYVKPEHRNHGLGQQLMRTVIDEARAMSLDYLIVHPSKLSFGFYRQIGFAEAEKALELRFKL
jgi:GNAT superfamily N-acetyltransferase